MTHLKKNQFLLVISMLLLVFGSKAQNVGVNSFPGMGLNGFHIFMAFMILVLFIYAMYLMIRKWKWIGLLMVGMCFLVLVILYWWALTY